MTTGLRFCLVLLFGWASELGAAEKSATVELTQVSAAELTRAVETHKGKVVVVDMWAEYCLPCRKKFPQMIALHKELAADGLVVIAVTIDDKVDRDKALEFLTKSRATFVNFHLVDSDDSIDTLQKRMATKAVPIVHVFDREGKKTSFETGIKDDEVEKLIRELVKRK
jgi:thiol-disulfide isomerase/thioredoxin